MGWALERLLRHHTDVRWAILPGLLLFVGACEHGTLTSRGCESRWDCTSGEVCSDGRCVSSGMEQAPPNLTAPDAGKPDRPIAIVDAGALVVHDASEAPADAMVPDVMMPDAGMAPPDSGPPDVGFEDPGCMGPTVAIEGRGYHCSIQAAVDAALPGDRIVVPAGRFDENVTIGTDLTLVGAGVDTVVAGISGPVFVVTSSVTVEDILVTSTNDVGWEISGEATMRRVTIGPAKYRGIDLQGGVLHAWEITINDISDNGIGVRVGPSASADLWDAYIYNCSDHGVFVRGDAVVSYSMIDTSGNFGIRMNEGNLRIDQTTLIFASQEAGVLVLDGHFEMYDSESSLNGIDGVALIDPSSWLVTGSTFSQNDVDGIWCDGPAGNPVLCENNSFSSNGGRATNCNCN